MKSVDWTKEPEIRWEKRLCPICNEPSGEKSNCFKIETDVDVINSQDESTTPRTLEVNGELYPVFSKQCYFRKNNEFWFYTNYPISMPMVTVISSVEGVETLVIRTPYKASVVIADQFDEIVVKNEVNRKYRSFINGFRKNKD